MNLLEGGAVRQETDHHVKEFLVGLVEDRLAAELDVLVQGREEILLLQKGSQCSQRSISRTCKVRGGIIVRVVATQPLLRPKASSLFTSNILGAAFCVFCKRSSMSLTEVSGRPKVSRA